MAHALSVFERANNIISMAREKGLRISAHGTVVTVRGSFPPGDKDAYVKIENDANQILAMFKQVRPGSVWGSDSGSVGGAVALEKGIFVLNKSGVEKALAAKFY
jgi:hypothetical protein